MIFPNISLQSDKNMTVYNCQEENQMTITRKGERRTLAGRRKVSRITKTVKGIEKGVRHTSRPIHKNYSRLNIINQINFRRIRL